MPDAMQSMYEASQARMEIVERKLERIASILEQNTTAIETNTAQVATFMEGLTRLENLIERGFERLQQTIQMQNESLRLLSQTTERQASHIDRLMSITETLIQQRVA